MWKQVFNQTQKYWERYEIYCLEAVHNHELYDEDQLAQIALNRMIPDEVKTRMLELHNYGVLNTPQIMILIDNEFEIPITWTKREVQNLFQGVVAGSLRR